MCGAADEVLTTLKDDHLPDSNKKTDVLALLGKMAEEQYAMLVSLGRRITDFGLDARGPQGEDALDENYGVAVVFDDQEQGQGGTKMDTYAKEEPQEEDEGEGVEADYEGVLHAEYDMDTANSGGDPDVVNPRTVDAYWLQRELNKFLKDPTQAVKKSNEVLEILKTSPDNRDCENRLVLLLGYDQFAFIKLLLKNKYTGMYKEGSSG